MLAKINSCAVVGLEGQLVTVEVDLANGAPLFMVVGLPDAAVQESRERVRAAIKNSGLNFPIKRVTVNLAPADLRKEVRHTTSRLPWGCSSQGNNCKPILRIRW